MNINAKKVRFSANCCFAFDGGSEDKSCLDLIEKFLLTKQPLALYGTGRFFNYLLDHCPDLIPSVKFVIEDDPSVAGSEVRGIPVLSPNELPAEIKTVFLCETISHLRWKMRKHLSSDIEVVCPDILKDLDWQVLPERAWIPFVENIYPIDIPEIEFLPGQDMLLIDVPSRNLSFMPNGLGYVHNALKKTNITFQTLDLDIIVYHRFHSLRLLDSPRGVLKTDKIELPADPWLTENYEVWQQPNALEFFKSEIEEIAQAVVQARPKILGLSIQACNISFSREVVRKVKKALPETIILVGGYSCYQTAVGLRAFPDCDYMVLGEADLTIGALVEELAQGKRPTGLPGVMSRFDPPDMVYKAGPMPEDLDSIENPKYEWFDLSIYRNWNHYLLTPIIATRGCKWSVCTFCAERFYWRARSPKNVVDEFEWLATQGCDLFMFNESDLNGRPEILLEICDEIIRRGLKIRLTGQLRIHKKSDRNFFQKLRAAGFVSLRFGVDAWAKNPIKLQKKGYTTDTIFQNLKECTEAGIYNEVNTVVGVPGETEQDIDDSIEFIIKCKPYIGRIANINPLLFVIGSVYWEEPEEHGIHFRDEVEKLYREYSTVIPSELWYSTDPYIDEHIRKARFQKVVLALHQNGFHMGEVAEQVIKDVEDGKGAENHARPGAREDTVVSKPVTSDSDVPTWPQPQKEKGVVVGESAEEEMDASGSAHNDKGVKVLQYGDNFYKVETNGEINLEKLFEKSEIKKPGWMINFIFLTRKILLSLKSPGQVFQLGVRALRVLKNQGYQKVLDRVKLELKANRLNCMMVGSTEITFDEKIPACELIFEGFHGYNIVKWTGKVYGIKQGNPFDGEKARAGGYEPGVIFSGESVMAVEALILQNLVENPVEADIAPRLVFEGFHGYNIVAVGDMFYGVKQGFAFDLEKANMANDGTDIYCKAGSREEVEGLISSLVDAKVGV